MRLRRSQPSEGLCPPLAKVQIRPGLTIIEVILSLAILTMSIVAIGYLVNMGADRQLDSQNASTAARLGSAKLAEVESGVTSLDTPGGEFDNSDAGWQWTMTAEPQGPTNLYLVTVTVSRNFKGRMFEFPVSQMVFDPSVKGAAGEVTRPDSTATGGNQ